MLEYKSEVITATKTTGIVSKNLKEKDVSILDELINKRAAEGWELVNATKLVKCLLIELDGTLNDANTGGTYTKGWSA